MADMQNPFDGLHPCLPAPLGGYVALIGVAGLLAALVAALPIVWDAVQVYRGTTWRTTGFVSPLYVFGVCMVGGGGIVLIVFGLVPC